MPAKKKKAVAKGKGKKEEEKLTGKKRTAKQRDDEEEKVEKKQTKKGKKMPPSKKQTKAAQKGKAVKGKAQETKNKRKKKEESESEEEEEKVPVKKGKGKGKAKITKKKSGSSEEEKKKGKGKASTKKKEKEKEKKTTKGKKAAEDSDDSEEEEKEKKIVTGVKKGKSMVDAKVPNADSYHVFEEPGKSYAASLMWSDLKHNNNKYYIIQLLQKDANHDQYMVWNRWGRVGADGQHANFAFGNLDNAKAKYQKKYDEKTNKGYTEIEISYEEEEEKKQPAKKKAKTKDGKIIESKLDGKVQDLIKQIFNMQMMKEQMIEIGYDAGKMPLGKLSKDTIKRGYGVLKKLSDVITGKKKGDLYDLSSEFFTVIPHDFGFKHMSNFVINTEKKLKDKLEMVEALGDIEIASRLIEEGSEEEINELDSNYKKLKCEISPVNRTSDEFKMIEKCVKNTHATTHSSYSLEILEAYKMTKDGENAKYQKNIGNDLLLWHGSRLTNYVGIISQGLRIAPPEAPVTGYMFGKGVYFADMVSKSANYCYAPQSDNVGLMLLCKVACGNFNPKYQADYNAANLPPNTQSTKGLGKTAPADNSYVKFKDYKVPLGEGKPTNIQSSLLYNEFIVYDTNQVQMEYLLKLKFNYKSGLWW